MEMAGVQTTVWATQVDDFPLIPSYRDTDGDGYGDFKWLEGDVCPYSTVEEVESGWIET